MNAGGPRPFTTPRRGLRIALLCGLLVLAVMLALRPRASGPEAELRRAMHAENLHSASLAFGRVGEKPRLLGIDAAPDAAYPYYSLSKPITAALVMAEVEKGRLRLDDQVGGATIRQLLQHRGGWDRSIAGDPVLHRQSREACTALSPPPRQFAPGTRAAYSNIGYCLLGQAAATAAGLSYPDLARRDLPETRAMRYDPWLGPAGGWSGNAATYFTFATRPLPAATANRPTGELEADYFGLGWKVHADGTLSHFGAYRSGYALVFRRGDRVIVALFGGMPADHEGARRRLRPYLEAIADAKN